MKRPGSRISSATNLPRPHEVADAPARVQPSNPPPAVNAGYVYESRVSGEDAGRLVVEYLRQHYPHSTATKWRERVANGLVFVDGCVASEGRPLRPGQSLQWRRPPWVEPPAPAGFAIAHLDAHLLVAIKPTGLPTLPGADFLEHTLLHRVRRFCPGASPLHRLGRATSGLVLFSRHRDAHRRLSTRWRSDVSREYLTLVRGDFPRTEQTCDAAIGPLPHLKLGRVYGAHPSGKSARSVFRLLAHRDDGSLVRVLIDSGRAHQIRIHAASLGFPLVGDKLYGDGPQPLPENETLPGTGGYLLHAGRLRIVHPSTGHTLELECRPPATLRPSRGTLEC